MKDNCTVQLTFIDEQDLRRLCGELLDVGLKSFHTDGEGERMAMIVGLTCQLLKTNDGEKR